MGRIKNSNNNNDDDDDDDDDDDYDYNVFDNILVSRILLNG